MSDYFKGCATATEIKTRYRKLAMEFHPDRPGGDTKIMQDINRQYEAALSGQHGATETGSDGQAHTYYYNAEHEKAVMAKLDELLRMKLPGCEVWLIGKWLWVKGDTRPAKDLLKSAGLRWHNERTAWYWKPYEGQTHYNKRASLDDLADFYGAKEFHAQNGATMTQ